MARSTRDEWAKRVERWQRSGLTAAQFAAQAGVNASTLSYWKWRLGKEGRDSGRTGGRGSEPRSSAVDFVELTGMGACTVGDDRVEVVVDGRYVVRVGADADGDALERVLEVLERRR